MTSASLTELCINEHGADVLLTYSFALFLSKCCFNSDSGGEDEGVAQTSYAKGTLLWLIRV